MWRMGRIPSGTRSVSSATQWERLRRRYIQAEVSFGHGAKHPDLILDSQLNVFQLHFAPVFVNFNATDTASGGPKVCGAGSNPEDGGEVGGLVLSLQAGGDFCILKATTVHPAGLARPTNRPSDCVNKP